MIETPDEASPFRKPPPSSFPTGALSARCPGCQAPTRPEDSTCPYCFTEIRAAAVGTSDHRKPQVLRLDGCTILGGSGYPLPPGREATLTFEASNAILGLLNAQESYAETLPYAEITSITIGGPGSVSAGGGFIGGGFGIGSALEGMGIALVLNALTTKYAKVNSALRLPRAKPREEKRTK